MLLVGLVAACLLAACGSSSSGASGDPLATELSYLPAGSPLVITLATDPGSPAIRNATALLGKVQLGAFVENALKQQLQQKGLNFDTDIRPLLGNRAVLSTLSPTLAGNQDKFLAAWVTKDADALNALVHKPSTGAHKSGSHDGATLYTFRGGVLAIDGATVVIADTAAEVNAALDRRANGGGLTRAEYNREVAGLPSSPLLQVFGDVKASLAAAKDAPARRIPWVAALTSYGVAVNAQSNGLSLDWHLDTTGRPLTPSQLPIAAGSTAPALVSGATGALGVRDPAQIATFIESAAQAVDPTGYARFVNDEAALRRATGIDVNGALGLLTGDLITSGAGTLGLVRAGVSDPARARRTLADLQSHIQTFSPKLRMKPVGGGFYLLTSPKIRLNIGVVGSQVVAGDAAPARLRAFATAPTSGSGGHGAVAFRVSLQQVARLTGSLVQSPDARLVLGQLRDLTGWLAATPSALTGNLTVTVK